MSVFLARADAAPNDNATFTVRLKGQAPNAQAVGAKVTFTTSDGKTQTAEVQAGGGYLSQGTAALTFGVPKGARGESIAINWPDGRFSIGKAPAAGQKLVEIAAPAK
jgi:enediyne biosynthesis protein E4